MEGRLPLISVKMEQRGHDGLQWKNEGSGYEMQKIITWNFPAVLVGIFLLAVPQRCFSRLVSNDRLQVVFETNQPTRLL